MISSMNNVKKDIDFLIKYFGIPTEISSHSKNGGSFAYVYFKAANTKNKYTMIIGGYSTYPENTIEVQLVCLTDFMINIPNDF